MVLGAFSLPPLSLDTDPSVDFKVYMDMQIRALATRPELFGLGGLQEWESGFADEETVRWIARLYRHYCIEGRTEPLAKDPYELTHILNPDFSRGTEAWAIYPADPESVSVRTHCGYSWLQGRFPRTSQGDSFLWMKRSKKKPNAFVQTIRNLTPGRRYSMKMITGDYQDLVWERSRKETHTLSIGMEGARMLSGSRSAFQFPFPSGGGQWLGKFKMGYSYWMNYHWRVFEAESETAILTVSDWGEKKKPGGPIGQELICNFLEIQPYLDE
jgi:hypothetical protein